MDEDDTWRPARDASGRFAPGGSGRPFGSRNKVSKRVALGLLADFEAHQDEVLARLRHWFLPQYVAMIARLLPRQTEAGGAELEALAPAEEARLIEAARVAFARIERGEGTLADLERALMGDPSAAGAADNIGDYR